MLAAETRLDEAPPGRRPRRAAPERRCLVSRESSDAAGMVRFVVSPDGELVPDVDGRLPGRGLWLAARRDIVATAVAHGVFQKAARARVHVAPDLAERVEGLLVRRCLDLIGLARRAGLAVAGYEKVRALVAKGRAGVVIQASDAAPGGRGRVSAAAAGVPEVTLFTVTELARAFGRETVVHAALERGPMAESFLRETARLAGFRPGESKTVRK
jgi:uncharacterized protein